MTNTPQDSVIAKITGLTMKYGERRVLDDLDMSVMAGERVALIGPSGSGKTTILRILIGLERPESGTVEIDGSYLWHVQDENGALRPAGDRNARSVRRSVGMIFQHFNLFPHMTALENVVGPMMHALGASKSDAITAATELLGRVGLDGHLSNKPAQLSGGQQQRVAIARSLALRPKIMLFDEVTSALDPEVVGEVLEVIRDLASDRSMAMVLVTHELTFAASIADRICMFDSGKVIEAGPPESLLKKPQHPRTQQFLRAVVER